MKFNLNSIGAPGRTALLILVTVAYLAALPGCSLLRKYFREVETVVVHDTRDSLIIRDRYIHDTLKVPVPVYVERIVTKDDSSHLENPYAVSDAWIKDGLLHHTLSTRGTVEAPVDIPVSDTTAIHNETEAVTHTEKVYVEKNLTWWQKVRLRAFWWLVGACAALLLWVFRKPLLKLIGL